MKKTEIKGTGGDIVLYKTKDGRVALDVRLEKETLWLSLNEVAALFGRDKSVISRHLRNIFSSNELKRGSTVAFFATVQHEGGRAVERQIEFFNLDVIISVGYRVNSRRGTQFRIWATQVTKHSEAMISTPVSRRRPRIYFTSWSRTMPSWMVTSASAPFFSSGSSTPIRCFIARTAASAWPTMRWLH